MDLFYLFWRNIFAIIKRDVTDKKRNTKKIDQRLKTEIKNGGIPYIDADWLKTLIRVLRRRG